MIRVKIPINELRNEMSKVEKSAQRSNRFLIAQALIKRYKDIIFRRHDGHRGKDKYKNSDLSASQKYSRSGSAIQANPDELLSKKVPFVFFKFIAKQKSVQERGKEINE